jgi:cytosine/adenosine deaminase-related metal-dependent hydrolase
VILRAPFILPIDSPPLKNGAVLVQNDTIVAVGPADEIKKQAQEDSYSIDLPTSILLPGFVNAHCHLELTSLKDLSYSGNFSNWIRKLVSLKPQVSENDYQRGLLQGIHWMLQSGITCVGDHVSFNTDLETIVKSPLRGVLFVEVLGVVKEVAKDLFEAAQNLEKIFGNSTSLFRITASPHSVHAIHPDILPKLFTETRPLLSIHLAESEDEKKLFYDKSGPLKDLIAEKNSEAIREWPLQSSSIKHLHHLGLLSKQVMAVHCNYLDPEDINLLSHAQISVVHCPSSHAYFSHQSFPLEELKRKKINIALGTDSLASGTSLSMLDQLKLAEKNYPKTSSEEWIRMATLNGAKALKMDSLIGSITPGKKADLIAVKIESEKMNNPFDEILRATKTHFVMIDGKVIT